MSLASCIMCGLGKTALCRLCLGYELDPWSKLDGGVGSGGRTDVQ
jgi:hypothetical protein